MVINFKLLNLGIKSLKTLRCKPVEPCKNERIYYLFGDIKPDIAYHGSPFNFDKFDASKIGTGEGLNKYGCGLYLDRCKKKIPFYANIRSADAPIHIGCTAPLKDAQPTVYTVSGLKNLKLKRVSPIEAKKIRLQQTEFEINNPEIDGLELSNQVVIFPKSIEKLNIAAKQDVIDFVIQNKNYPFRTWTTDQTKLDSIFNR